MHDLTRHHHLMKTNFTNPTGQWCPSGNCQTCLLGAGQTVLIATQNSPKLGE